MEVFMNTFTWSGGTVHPGMKISQDKRLGDIIFLGESGRGRHYEKIGISRFRPAEVIDGRVFKARPVKIIPAPKDGKPGRSFYILEGPRKNTNKVLIRICTLTSYIRGAYGRFFKEKGAPETLTCGQGAFGDAGRVGTWEDGLVVMQPGDVLRVYPSRGDHSYALWLKDDKPVTTTWSDYENIQAVEKTKALLEKGAETPAMYGNMKTFTFSNGQVTDGISVSSGVAGKVISLGEKGRGRSRVEVPLVDGSQVETLTTAAVVKLDKTKYGLIQGDKKEDAVLVRLLTSGPYTKGTRGEVETWKGDPIILASGSGAHGIAGRVGGWQDSLAIMREGDAIYVRQEGGYKSAGPWCVYIKGGEICSEIWHTWKLGDAKCDPEFYVAKGVAPIAGGIPQEWIGKIVTVCYLSEEQSGCGPTKTYLEERATGELVRIESDSVILNLGWDGRDYHESNIAGEWVKLETNKYINRLEREARVSREQIRTKAEELRDKAIIATQQSYFSLTEEDLRRQMEEIANQQGFDTMPTDKVPVEEWGKSLTWWIEDAEKLINKFNELTAKLKELEKRQASGEILMDFGGHFRRMGMSGNKDYWVILADGKLHDPDEISYRKRYKSEGSKSWRLINNNELALSWNCVTMRDILGSSSFKVAKAPVGGCTQDQLETVARIEDELGVPKNTFGLHVEIQKVFDDRMSCIRSICQECDILISTPDDLDYVSLSGEWGQQIDPDCVNGRIEGFIDWNKEFAEQCENRDAQLIDIQSAADGILEFLVYDKWGERNLNIRWRENG